MAAAALSEALAALKSRDFAHALELCNQVRIRSAVGVLMTDWPAASCERSAPGRGSSCHVAISAAPPHALQAAQADPGNAEVLATRARVRNKLGDHLEAVEDAGRAAELDPQLALAFAEKGCAAPYGRRWFFGCRIASWWLPAIPQCCCSGGLCRLPYPTTHRPPFNARPSTQDLLNALPTT